MCRFVGMFFITFASVGCVLYRVFAGYHMAFVIILTGLRMPANASVFRTMNRVFRLFVSL
ncbi:hypothetical protein F5Y02DRAFT_399837 [Annulohypoxylon stygium]|nr:hypothetical protein F5Y02DRAFT_399837 [Annulohypoxylon stygium]